MTRKRPVSVLVFAILNLVFGGLGLVCNMCGVVGQAVQGPLQKLQAQQGGGGAGDFDQLALNKHLAAKIPGIVVIQWGQLGIGIVLSCVLVLAGIGLLRMNSAGRWASVAYSVLTILLQLATLIFSFAFVAPVMEEWFKQQPGQLQLPSGFITGLLIVGSIGPCLNIIYGAVLLVFMLLPGTARAFADRGNDFRGAEGDYYDPDFQRQRREPPPET